MRIDNFIDPFDHRFQSHLSMNRQGYPQLVDSLPLPMEKGGLLRLLGPFLVSQSKTRKVKAKCPRGRKRRLSLEGRGRQRAGMEMESEP